MFKASWHDATQVVNLLVGPFARSVHRKGFPGACLAISKDGAVVALDGRFNHFLAHLRKQFLLRRIFTLYGIEVKSLWIWSFKDQLGWGGNL